jgi:hypothetical protein
VHQLERLALRVAKVVHRAQPGQHVDEHPQRDLKGHLLRARHDLRPAHAVDELADHEHLLPTDDDVADPSHVRVLQRRQAPGVAHPVGDLLVAVHASALHTLDDHDHLATVGLRVEGSTRRHHAGAELAQHAEPLRGGDPAGVGRRRGRQHIQGTPVRRASPMQGEMWDTAGARLDFHGLRSYIRTDR